MEVDKASVASSDISKHGVLINVPSVFLSLDPNKPNKIATNYRVIEFDTLLELLTNALHADTADEEEQLTIAQQNIQNIKNVSHEGADLSRLIEIIEMITQTTASVTLDNRFININTRYISFDIIRKYTTDPINGMLISSEPQTCNGYQFYSQIKNDAERIFVREKMNDTDLNRAHYTLEQLTASLMFQEDRLYGDSSRYVNLCLFFICLVWKSNPVENLSSNELAMHYFSLLIDSIVRSTLITCWLKFRSTKYLVRDIIQNYDANNFIVKLYQRESPGERAKLIIETLAKEDNSIARHLSYEMYERTITEHRQEIEGQWFYTLGNAFVAKISTMEIFELVSRMQNEKLFSKILK